MTAPSSQIPQPTSRLPLPRARSVSHLRTQSTSSIPIPKPTISRKPSIPLRSGTQTTRPVSGLAPVPNPARGSVVAPPNKSRALPGRPALHGVKSSLALGPKKTVPTPTSNSEKKPVPAPSKGAASPGLFTSTNSTFNKNLAGYGQPPVDRRIRRVVSRGLVMNAPSPTKTHTPSPTKKSHRATDDTPVQLRPLSPKKEARVVSDTPLMPRLAKEMGNIDTLPLIADASFSFHESLHSAKQQDEENEELKAALKASEAALARIKSERDEARATGEELRKAMEEKQWTMVKEAIEDEIERSKEYRAALAELKGIIIAMETQRAATVCGPAGHS